MSLTNSQDESKVDTSKLELFRGTLDVLILKALVWGPLHGYAITSFIRPSELSGPGAWR